MSTTVFFAVLLSALLHATWKALREVSIVFTLLIGVGILGERLDLAKVASTMATLVGAGPLRLERG